MAVDIKKLTNVNVYLNGTSTLGRVEEFDVPEPPYKMADFKALGLFGETEVVTGIGKMEARIKWSSFYKDVIPKVANPFQGRQIIIRGNVDVFENGTKSSIPAKFTLIGMPKTIPGAKFKPGDNVESESRFSCTYQKFELDGELMYEIDVFANILKVGGQDLLAEFRANT